MAFLDENGLAELWRLSCDKHNDLVNAYAWRRVSGEVTYSIVEGSITKTANYATSSQGYFYRTATANAGGIVLSGEFRANANHSSVIGAYINFESVPCVIKSCSTSGSHYVLTLRSLDVLVNDTTETTYLISESADAYPPQDNDGYTYTALGRLAEKIQCVRGSYVGTGAYGASYPCSLTFDVEPKVVFFYNVPGTHVLPYVWCETSIMLTSSVQTKSLPVTVSGKTMSWYSTENAASQMNLSGCPYPYLVII